jgi:hypothetical protein
MQVLIFSDKVIIELVLPHWSIHFQMFPYLSPCEAFEALHHLRESFLSQKLEYYVKMGWHEYREVEVDMLLFFKPIDGIKYNLGRFFCQEQFLLFETGSGDEVDSILSRISVLPQSFRPFLWPFAYRHQEMPPTVK